MRLWSIHPSYLDVKGLVALWREALLAQKVLAGKTKGYKNHPQLSRFKATVDPLVAINTYLYWIWKYANYIGYNFDQTKINQVGLPFRIEVTRGQILYEFAHLRKKLEQRDHNLYQELSGIEWPLSHPLFKIVDGEVEPWEKSYTPIK